MGWPQNCSKLYEIRKYLQQFCGRDQGNFSKLVLVFAVNLIAKWYFWQMFVFVSEVGRKKKAFGCKGIFMCPQKLFWYII
jgi:hypothetical protein